MCGIFSHELKPLTNAESIVIIVVKAHGFGRILVARVSQYPIHIDCFKTWSNDTYVYICMILYYYVNMCVSTYLHMKHDVEGYKSDYAIQRWMRLSL